MTATVSRPSPTSTDGQPRPRRRFVGLIVGALLVVAVLGAGLVELVRLEDEQTRRAAELDELIDGYEQTVDERAALEQEQRALISRAEAAELDAFVWSSEATQALDSRDQLALDAFLTVIDTQGLEGQLETVGAALSFRGSEATDLATCLTGLQEAYGRVAAADDRGAVTALQGVADVCRRAEEAVTNGEVSHTFPFDFADPAVVFDGSDYWAYSTNGAGGDVQLIRSDDLESWDWVGTAMTQLPQWAAPHLFWAPSVFRLGDRWLLYYTGNHAASDKQCIGVGVASSPQGPFVDPRTEPLVCQLDQGGSIDPSAFVGADGTPYLTWKGEGETIGGTASLWAQELEPSGTALVGEPRLLATPGGGWEGRTIEGPSMRFVGGTYHLLYSANSWNTAQYAVGHAVCDTPLGPCRKSGSPVLTSEGSRTGPGGAEFFTAADGSLRVAFHAWVGDAVGYPNRRTLRTKPVHVSGASLSL